VAEELLGGELYLAAENPELLVAVEIPVSQSY